MEGAVCSPAHGKSFIDAKLSSGDRLSLRKRSEIEAELLPVRPRLQQILLLLHCGKRQRPERELKTTTTEERVKTLEMKKTCWRTDWQEKKGNKKWNICSGGARQIGLTPTTGLCCGVIRGVVELLQLSAPPLITVQRCIYRGVPNSIFIHFIFFLILRL